MQLRPYQKKAIDNVRREYSAGNKSILVVSPTGSGKGVMLSEIIKSANDKGKRVMFLVHRREILFQVSEYMDKYDIKHGVILSGEDYVGGRLVELATVQTIRNRMKRQFFKMADIIIVDEAHHATAESYLSIIREFSDNMIIGFTATPCRKTGLGLGAMFHTLVNVATIAELTRDGYLVPIKYFAPSEPDLSKVKCTGGDYNGKQLDEVMSQPKLIGDIVENWIRIGEDRQTVVFTTTVAHSVAVCEAFMQVGIQAEHIDGTTDKEERKGVLDRFRAGDTRILCNCAVMTEGVDIPDIACVVMARPTKSLSLYMQTIGRGMRPAPGKEDLIYIDHAGACYEHGPVEEITEWTLEAKTKNGSKKAQERKERNSKPLTCMTCDMLYRGQIKCPRCGTVPDMKKYPKDVEYIDYDLGEVCFKSRKAKTKATPADKQDWYSQLIGYGREKNYKPGWAAHKFKVKFGVWPNKLQKTSKTPTLAVLGWIRGQAARDAIARKARERKEASNG